MIKAFNEDQKFENEHEREKTKTLYYKYSRLSLSTLLQYIEFLHRYRYEKQHLEDTINSRIQIHYN